MDVGDFTTGMVLSFWHKSSPEQKALWVIPTMPLKSAKYTVSHSLPAEVSSCGSLNCD